VLLEHGEGRCMDRHRTVCLAVVGTHSEWRQHKATTPCPCFGKGKYILL
jgi:hypothetical protein